MRTLALTFALILTLGFAGASFSDELGQQFWQYSEESMITTDEAVGQEVDKGEIAEERSLELQSPDFVI